MEQDYDILIVLWTDGSISVKHRLRDGDCNVYGRVDKVQGSGYSSRRRIWEFIQKRKHVASLHKEDWINPGVYYYIKL